MILVITSLWGIPISVLPITEPISMPIKPTKKYVPKLALLFAAITTS
jgi:hypothetical protein